MKIASAVVIIGCAIAATSPGLRAAPSEAQQQASKAFAHCAIQESIRIFRTGSAAPAIDMARESTQACEQHLMELEQQTYQYELPKGGEAHARWAAKFTAERLQAHLEKGIARNIDNARAKKLQIAQ